MILIRNISHVINYEKAKTRNYYQEMLTATVSHEMMTPLNAIINMTTILENKLLKKQTESKIGFKRGDT
jgi:signal transduction histidine kinase